MNGKALLAKGVLALVVELAVFAALLFGSAGTAHWTAGWVFMAIFFVFGLAITLWLARADPRTPRREDVLADPEGTASLGQGVRDRGIAALCSLVDPDAPGRREARVVGGSWLATPLGSPGTPALVLRHIPDLQGERVSRPRGEAARGAGSEGGKHRPVPLREAPHVLEHVPVLPRKRAPARLVVGPAAVPGATGTTRLEDHPRRPDAEEPIGGIQRVRAEREVPAYPPHLVTVHQPPTNYALGSLLVQVIFLDLLVVI